MNATRRIRPTGIPTADDSHARNGKAQGLRLDTQLIFVQWAEIIFEDQFLVTGQDRTLGLVNLRPIAVTDDNSRPLPGLTGCRKINQQFKDEEEEDTRPQDNLLMTLTFEYSQKMFTL